VDSLVLSVFHRRVLRADHFQHDPATGGVRLRDDGRRIFLREYELRMLTLFRHDASGERVSYRRALVLQAEQLARVLRFPGVTYLPIRMS
jgi:CRISPR-associated protein Cas1